MEPWAASDEPLAPERFLKLYRGALLLETKVRRLRAGTLLLLTGRLGLSLDEALHCHDGWIDWKTGVVEIPSKDPCACAACWSVARERRDYTEPAVEVLYEECWAPPPERGARSVPFAWSPRCRAALAATYGRWDVLELSRDEATDVVEMATRKADGLTEPPSPSELAASAGLLFRQLGLGVDATADLLGVQREFVAPFATETETNAGEMLSRLTGEGDAADQFTVACGTEQLPGEPFDPSDESVPGGPASDEPEGVPRPVSLPDTVDYDASDHAEAGGPTRRPSPSTSGGTAASSASPGHQPEPQQHTNQAQQARNQGQQSGDRRQQSDDARRQPSGQRRQSSDQGRAVGTDGASAPPGGETDSAGESRSSEEQLEAPDPDEMPDWDDVEESSAESSSTPREFVTQPVVADVSTRVAVDGISGGQAVAGRVVLGSAELLVLRDADVDGETGYQLFDLDDLWDVQIDQVPSRLKATFPHSVSVVFRPANGGQQVLSIQLPPTQRRDLASVLFRLALNATPVSLTDPARIAGRVTDTRPTSTVISVRPDRVHFTDPDDQSVECSIDLEDVIHVERTERTVDGESRPTVMLRRVTENRPVTTAIAASDERLQRLVFQYLRRVYRQTLSDVRELRLSDSEKMILVALYSTDGTPDLGSLLDLTDTELDAALQSLVAKELVRRPEAETELTGRGQLVVSDRLDSVNQ